MLDVTDRSCAVGDVVTFIGRAGDASITVQDVADAGGFSPYEILTGLRGRLPRQFVGATQ
jgi:alanine racemase